LANGEVAINSVDGKLFYSTPSGSIQFITNQQTFATIISNGSAILATSTADTLVINPSNGIQIQTNTISKTITIDGSDILAYAQSAYDLANAETLLSGWKPNSIIVANTNGYIANSNAFFFSSNNSIVIDGDIDAGGNVTIGNNIDAGGNFTANGNVTANGSIVIGVDIDAGGNVTANGSIVIGVDIDAGGNVTIGNNIDAGGNVTANGSITANSFGYTDGTAPGYTYQLDDISSYFDGKKKTFPLTINNGTSVTPNNPNQLTIAIGNVPVFSTQRLYDYNNLPEISPFNSGFYASNNTINFATPPIPGMSFYGTFRTNNDLMPSFSYKQTPFSALNIMLGP
jgi:hypothetical protein